MTPVRLEPAALRSRVKHSTTEPLRSLGKELKQNDHDTKKMSGSQVANNAKCVLGMRLFTSLTVYEFMSSML